MADDMHEDKPANTHVDALNDVEQSLAKLQDERCACWAQLQSLLANGPAAASEISHYISRIDAINDIMLALARVTTVTPPLQHPTKDLPA